jgi:hypothetical protein
MYFVNDIGTVYRKPIDSGGFVDQIMVSGEALQAGITLVSGSGDLVKPGIDYYDFFVADVNDVPFSKSYKLNLDRRCRINDYQLAFRDRKGSMLSYAFQLHDVENGTVQRTTYNKEVIGAINLETNKWNYESHERGMKSVDITKEDTLTLRANYIKTQDELDLFERLVTSPDVFIKIGDDWLAVTVEDRTYNNPRLRQKRLQKKEIKVKLANQDIING